MSGDRLPLSTTSQTLSPGFGHGGASSIYAHANDPRISSSQSLVSPGANQNDGRRKLLLIYIHGFMGDETSFRSFPAHVHNILSITLQESHTIHSKVYPHYRSRRPIKDAVEDFSTWLEPHESPMTDVILLAHSMGGLLAADVVLLPPKQPIPGTVFRHRIIGLCSFDVPFLGLHPGIIPAGLSSIFKPWPEPPETQQQGNNPSSGSSSQWFGAPPRQDTLFSPPKDPRFNPRYSNDIVLPVRKGWEGPLHFLKKHSDNLWKASTNYVKSHLEFGGAMADYPNLKARYNRIRGLEEERLGTRRIAMDSFGAAPPRVRFVNYYTASHGRPKKERPKSQGHNLSPSPSRQGVYSQSGDLSITSTTSLSTSPHRSPNASFDGRGEQDSGSPPAATTEELATTSDEPHNTHGRSQSQPNVPFHSQEPLQSATALSAPHDPSTSSVNLSTTPPSSTPGLSPYSSQLALSNSTLPSGSTPGEQKKIRERKFCMLPSKGSDGTRDPVWIRVFMKDMDEVGAHTQLFFLGDTYEQLVGDTAARIESWVGEEMTRRLMEQFEADGAYE
jgi:pimeloyl-ACP methyl ester carboxylesterase